MIYVTHDQHEALTFADLVTVMSNGKIVQTGTPEELHTEPASPFIGYFIGSPGMNILDATLGDAGLQCGPYTVPITPGLRQRLASHGIDMDVVTDQLRVDGVNLFAQSFTDLLGNLEQKLKQRRAAS